MPYDITYIRGLPSGAVVKNSPASEGDAEDVGSILRLGGSPEVGNGTLFQYVCLGKSHGQRRLAAYSPWSRKESDMNEQLNTHTHTQAHKYICVCVLLSNYWYMYICMYVSACVLSHAWPFVTPWTIYSLPGSSVHGIFHARPGVGFHFLLQYICDWITVLYTLN